tara:strand:- start:142 stop:1212 length:1071 start_codon:yes stop_codon:yes gene_type:complete
MKLLHVVGARPNFMKVSPVWWAIAKETEINQSLIHTGQHYDINMSDVFFSELDLCEPDEYLGVGSGTHAEQTAAILVAMEKVISQYKPDLVMVYGDVNSTMAASLVCAKLLIPVGHVEAGLRSFDRTMPEEINRVITDQIAELLFTPSKDGNENLIREGVSSEKIHLVGNVMIDTLVKLLPKAEMIPAEEFSEPYALVTLHRPSNVDHGETLHAIIESLIDISNSLQVIFPVHPRTRQQIEEFELEIPDNDRLQLVEPMGYLDFLALHLRATVVITDSGGVQEEATYLGVPCLTVRENTERPVTVTVGTNSLVGRDMRLLKRKVASIIAGNAKKGKLPPLWDGEAAIRIARILDCL